jgi:hypothetical protein
MINEIEEYIFDINNYCQAYKYIKENPDEIYTKTLEQLLKTYNNYAYNMAAQYCFNYLNNYDYNNFLEYLPDNAYILDYKYNLNIKDDKKCVLKQIIFTNPKQIIYENKLYFKIEYKRNYNYRSKDEKYVNKIIKESYKNISLYCNIIDVKTKPLYYEENGIKREFEKGKIYLMNPLIYYKLLGVNVQASKAFKNYFNLLLIPNKQTGINFINIGDEQYDIHNENDYNCINYESDLKDLTKEQIIYIINNIKNEDIKNILINYYEKEFKENYLDYNEFNI